MAFNNNNFDKQSMTNSEKERFDKGRVKTSSLAFCCVEIAKLCAPSFQVDEKQTYLFWTEDIPGGIRNFFPAVKRVKFEKNLQVDHTPRITQHPEVFFTFDQQGQIDTYNKSVLGLAKDQIVQLLLVSAKGLDLMPEIVLIIGKVIGIYTPVNVTDPSFKVRVFDAHKFVDLSELIVFKITKKVVGDTNQNLDELNLEFIKDLFDIHPERNLVAKPIVEVKEKTALEKLGDFFDV